MFAIEAIRTVIGISGADYLNAAMITDKVFLNLDKIFSHLFDKYGSITQLGEHFHAP